MIFILSVGKRGQAFLAKVLGQKTVSVERWKSEAIKTELVPRKRSALEEVVVCVDFLRCFMSLLCYFCDPLLKVFLSSTCRRISLESLL